MEKIVNNLREKMEKGEIDSYILATDKTLSCGGKMKDLLATIGSVLRVMKDAGLEKEDAQKVVDIAFTSDDEFEKMGKEAERQRKKLKKLIEGLNELFGEDDDE